MLFCRYLTVISTPSDSPQTQANFSTYILESDKPTGPFKMLVFLKNLGPQAYFVNFPSGFLAKEKGADGSYEAVLSWSQNWGECNNTAAPPLELELAVTVQLLCNASFCGLFARYARQEQSAGDAPGTTV